jgi:hypothetical protein
MIGELLRNRFYEFDHSQVHRAKRAPEIILSTFPYVKDKELKCTKI